MTGCCRICFRAINTPIEGSYSRPAENSRRTSDNSYRNLRPDFDRPAVICASCRQYWQEQGFHHVEFLLRKAERDLDEMLSRFRARHPDNTSEIADIEEQLARSRSLAAGTRAVAAAAAAAEANQQPDNPHDQLSPEATTAQPRSSSTSEPQTRGRRRDPHRRVHWGPVTIIEDQPNNTTNDETQDALSPGSSSSSSEDFPWPNMQMPPFRRQRQEPHGRNPRNLEVQR